MSEENTRHYKKRYLQQQLPSENGAKPPEVAEATSNGGPKVKRKRKNCRGQFRHEGIELIKLGTTPTLTLCKPKRLSPPPEQIAFGLHPRKPPDLPNLNTKEPVNASTVVNNTATTTAASAATSRGATGVSAATLAFLNAAYNVPVSAAQNVPVSAANKAFVSAANNVPVTATNNAFLSAAYNVPVGAANNAFASAANNVPVSAANNVPVSAANEVPVTAANNAFLHAAYNILVNAANNAFVSAASNIPVSAANSVPVTDANNAFLSAAYNVPVSAAKTLVTRARSADSVDARVLRGAANSTVTSNASCTHALPQMVSQRRGSQDDGGKNMLPPAAPLQYPTSLHISQLSAPPFELRAPHESVNPPETHSPPGYAKRRKLDNNQCANCGYDGYGQGKSLPLRSDLEQYRFLCTARDQEPPSRPIEGTKLLENEFGRHPQKGPPSSNGDAAPRRLWNVPVDTPPGFPRDVHFENAERERPDEFWNAQCKLANQSRLRERLEGPQTLLRNLAHTNAADPNKRSIAANFLEGHPLDFQKGGPQHFNVPNGGAVTEQMRRQILERYPLELSSKARNGSVGRGYQEGFQNYLQANNAIEQRPMLPPRNFNPNGGRLDMQRSFDPTRMLAQNLPPMCNIPAHSGIVEGRERPILNYVFNGVTNELQEQPVRFSTTQDNDLENNRMRRPAQSDVQGNVQAMVRNGPPQVPRGGTIAKKAGRGRPKRMPVNNLGVTIKPSGVPNSPNQLNEIDLALYRNIMNSGLELFRRPAAAPVADHISGPSSGPPAPSNPRPSVSMMFPGEAATGPSRRENLMAFPEHAQREYVPHTNNTTIRDARSFGDRLGIGETVPMGEPPEPPQNSTNINSNTNRGPSPAAYPKSPDNPETQNKTRQSRRAFEVLPKESPENSNNNNYTEMSALKRQLMSPPKELVSLPKELMSAPKELVSPPKDLVPPPKELNSPPIELVSPPKELISPPKELVSPPKELVPPPKELNSPPIELVSPPKELISPPKELVSPPKEQISPPKELVSPPKELISPPKELLSPPKELVSPPKELMSPPKELVSPPKEVASPPKERMSTPEELVLPPEELLPPKEELQEEAEPSQIPSPAEVVVMIDEKDDDDDDVIIVTPPDDSPKRPPTKQANKPKNNLIRVVVPEGQVVKVENGIVNVTPRIKAEESPIYIVIDDDSTDADDGPGSPTEIPVYRKNSIEITKESLPGSNCKKDDSNGSDTPTAESKTDKVQKPVKKTAAVKSSFLIKDIITSTDESSKTLKAIDSTPPQFSVLTRLPSGGLTSDRRQSIETASSASSTSSINEPLMSPTTAKSVGNDQNKIPRGKLFYFKQNNTFRRYFDDAQKQLFLHNLKEGEGKPGADFAEETIVIPPGVSFSTNDQLTVEEYIEEMIVVQKVIPEDFYNFYKFVTGYQILYHHNPVTFLTFLNIYNTNGLNNLLDKYLANPKKR